MAAVKKLPLDVESDILSRLPVKSLLRFKSVQKSWYSLISSPFFINSHRLRHQNQKDNLLLIQKHHHNRGSVIEIVDTRSNVRSTFEKPYPDEYEYDVVDSSNGVVCIYGQTFAEENAEGCDMDYFILWNPALRITKTIRNQRMITVRHDATACVGFGFHTRSNDYKVITFTDDLLTLHKQREVEIYSLNSDSWRKIKGAADSWRKIKGTADSLGELSNTLHFGVYISDAALIPNFYGAYCWLAVSYGEGHLLKAKIILFDMGDEVFKEMMLPFTVSEIEKIKLFNCKDSLGVLELCNNPAIYHGKFCYVWVMKEYGEPKSLTKLCKFEPREAFDITFVGIALETELVLMTHYWYWHVVDMDKLQIDTSSTEDIRGLRGASRVISFTESLVLLDAMNKKKDLVAIDCKPSDDHKQQTLRAGASSSSRIVTSPENVGHRCQP